MALVVKPPQLANNVRRPDGTQSMKKGDYDRKKEEMDLIVLLCHKMLPIG